MTASRFALSSSLFACGEFAKFASLTLFFSLMFTSEKSGRVLGD